MTPNESTSERTVMHPRPKFPILDDAPVAGEAVALDIRNAATDERIAVSCALLGGGRDYADVADAQAAALEISGAGLEVTVAGPYSTISALVADYPTASLDPTARRLLAHEKAQAAYDVELAAWRAAVEAAGLEPCDRCGGAGGHKSWPGFTCYGCDGAGTQAPEARA